MPEKYDDVLMPFLALMRAELHANSDKGDRPAWLAMDADTAMLEVYHHAAKLAKAVRNDDAARIREHAADVANMALMLADVCGALTSAADGAEIESRRTALPERCTYPNCNCPFDAPGDPNWCARGLASRTEV